MKTKREIAKFAAGAACWEAIGHSMLAFSGLLPLTVWGVTVTPSINMVWILLMFLLSALLARFGWFAPRPVTLAEHSSRPGPKLPAARLG